ncbi:MAG: hypothetical protein BRD23_01160 [Halobacteriales archaeon SW_9_67_25]|jgi:membrane protein YdbS with pleckstrin-like domain|nr:MAG: hypothetical protein BRD23_01160 [Halobacteriales archaeon SW_9_67_25]
MADDGTSSPGADPEAGPGRDEEDVGADVDEAAGTRPGSGADGVGTDADRDTDATDAVPDAEAVEAYTTGVREVSARVQVNWAVRLLVGLAILAGIARVVVSGLGIPLDPRAVPAGAVALGLLGLVWVHLRYRAWSYRLREDALYLERGVFTQVTTVAPHVRIQHVDTRRSPLERALGLSTLVVYTAGSRGADVSIPGLTPDEAGDLQRRLKELAIESEGGDAL